MKRILSIVCIMRAALASFGQTTRWTDVTNANDTLVGHKLYNYLPDGNREKYKVVVLIYGSA